LFRAVRAGLWTLLVSLMLVGASSARAETRILKFYNLHTKERGTFAYKVNGRYDQKVLRQLDHFMRDWRKNQPTKMNPQLWDIVWEAQRMTGARGEIHVICGFRSPGTNAMLKKRGRGVAKESQHTRGNALDFFIPGVPLSKIREAGFRLQRGGVGFYPRSGSPFVHLDTGNVRAWPRMSRQQLLALFPDGKTVHLPSDGKPLKGYAVAMAEVKRAKAGKGKAATTAVAFADPTPQTERAEGGKTITAWLNSVFEAEAEAAAAPAPAGEPAPKPGAKPKAEPETAVAVASPKARPADAQAAPVVLAAAGTEEAAAEEAAPAEAAVPLPRAAPVRMRMLLAAAERRRAEILLAVAEEKAAPQVAVAAAPAVETAPAEGGKAAGPTGYDLASMIEHAGGAVEKPDAMGLDEGDAKPKAAALAVVEGEDVDDALRALFETVNGGVPEGAGRSTAAAPAGTALAAASALTGPPVKPADLTVALAYAADPLVNGAADPLAAAETQPGGGAPRVRTLAVEAAPERLDTAALATFLRAEQAHDMAFARLERPTDTPVLVFTAARAATAEGIGLPTGRFSR